jgi:hypothetical protein
LKVLVDTCIWSHVLRSNKSEFATEVKNLETLIADQRVLIIGAIRQEVLSGYSDLTKFEGSRVASPWQATALRKADISVVRGGLLRETALQRLARLVFLAEAARVAMR